MGRIRDQADVEAKQFGIDVIDVRLKRADLPAENSQAIYRRMQTERERDAKELRAQGAEMAQRIRARADRERVVLLAEARKEAQITRGEGDATAVAIFADAFGKDVDFFTFYRSMQAYRDALGDDNTSFVLSPEGEFFRFFGNSSPTLSPAQEARAPAGAAPAGQPAAVGGEDGTAAEAAADEAAPGSAVVR
jgi:membrane protease subunit HflC